MSKAFRFPSIGRRRLLRSLPSFTSELISPTTWRISPTSPTTRPIRPTKPIKPEKEWLVVGLGNYDYMYTNTRQNVGFGLVDAVCHSQRINFECVRSKTLIRRGYIGNTRIVLAKPKTFLNLCGWNVSKLQVYYKIPVKQVLVVCDDMELPFGKLSLLPKGGHGGHIGLKSIIDNNYGTCDFPRLKIGIGCPPGKMDSADFLLQHLSQEEHEEMRLAYREGVKAVRILMLEGFKESAKFVNTVKPLCQLDHGVASQDV